MNNSLYSRKSAKLPGNTRNNTRKSVSPTRLEGWRPSSWIGKAQDNLSKTQVLRFPSVSQVNLIAELNGNEIKAQDKDIEIERL